ncbi:MAG: hypothetical protein WCZ20_07115 [Hydrogenophaga sp.]
MFTNRNDILDGRVPTVFPAGSEVVAQRATIALVAADLDANDCGAVTILPTGCVPVALIYDSDDLDTNGTATITASVGLINADESDLSTVLATGITASRDGTAAHVVTKEMVALAPAPVDRKVGVKFTAAAATKAAGVLGLTLLYRAA